MRLHRTVLAVCAILGIAACGGKDAANQDACVALGAHFTQLARAEADKLPADHPDRKAVTADLALLPKAAEQLVAECRAEKWSDELRACFLAARTADQFKTECASLLAATGAGKTAPETP